MYSCRLGMPNDVMVSSSALQTMHDAEFIWLAVMFVVSLHTATVASTFTAVLTEICSWGIYGWTCSLQCWRLLVGETLNDFLEYAGKWQLVYCAFVQFSFNTLSVTVAVSWILFCSSSLFTSHDASWLAWLHCHNVADLVPGTAIKPKCTDVWLMWSCIMNEKLHTATLPLHLACFSKIIVQTLIVKVLWGTMGSKKEKEPKLTVLMISFTCWCLLLLAMTKSQCEVRPAKEWRTLTDGVWLRRPLSVSYFLSASQTAGHFCDLTVVCWPVLINILFNKLIETLIKWLFSFKAVCVKWNKKKQRA